MEYDREKLSEKHLSNFAIDRRKKLHQSQRRAFEI